MAAVSVVRKLERCERLGRARQGEAILNGESYQAVMYKIKIKDYFTTNQGRLQNLQVQTACRESSPLPPCIKLQHITLHEQGDFSSPWPPCKLQEIYLHEQDDEIMQLQSLQNYEENETPWLQHPWKLHENVQHDSKKSSQGIPPKPLKLQPSTVQENEEASCARSTCKLQEILNEREEEINWTPRSSANLQKTGKEREEDPRSPRKLQKSYTEDEIEQLGSGEDGRGRGGPPWKLQKEVQEKVGGGVWEGVKKIECECCGMEEECTGGYEEKVRAGLRGHWLCGLCEEAVGEERKRGGGSVQTALAAHMQPCRRFSRRARSKASPPPSDVGVPHAVCRLLCRHLSTPSSHRHSSPSAFLSRSSSCLPSLPN